MHYFDYESVAQEANIPREAVETLCARARADFPRDEMMYELRVLRMCLAVLHGWSRLDDLLAARSSSRTSPRERSASPVTP
jgi:hypothetical protein